MASVGPGDRRTLEDELFGDADIVTKWSDYILQSPEFFIQYLKTEIPKRDVGFLTKGRIQGVNISGEHPLVRLTSSLLKNGTLNFTGILPAVSVVEGDEVEDQENLGYGVRMPFGITQSWIDDFRAKFTNIAVRNSQGLLSDSQLLLLEAAIANNQSSPGAGDGAILIWQEGFYIRESIFVSVWTHSVDERSVIGDMVRSVIFDMRRAMKACGIKDIRIRTAKGLINSNFGDILYGQETTIDFTTYFHNYIALKEAPLENVLDGDNKLTIFDTIQDDFTAIDLNLDVRSKVSSNTSPGEYVDPNPGSELS